MKPNVTAEISKVGRVYCADEAAESIIIVIHANRFCSTVVLMPCNSFMLNSSGGIPIECRSAGPLKFVAYFVTRIWPQLVDSSAQQELIRAEMSDVSHVVLLP